MFFVFTLFTLVVVIFSIIGMVKHSKNQKMKEDEWAKFIEKHPSKEDKDKSQTT